MRKQLLLTFTLLFAVAMFAQTNEVVVPGSQTKKFTSTIATVQEYVLQISLPAGYANSAKKYPVVYSMNSQWDFPLLAALYGEQYYDGFIPEFIDIGAAGIQILH